VGVHGHVFVNAGTVLPLSGAGAPRSLGDVTRSLRAAAGTVSHRLIALRQRCCDIG
jgi:hypothetical protein